MSENFEVIIAGAGPVGLGAAIELGQRGVRCALVEREVGEHRIPKGQSLTNRTLEHFYFWNCVQSLREARRLRKGFPIGNVTAYRDLASSYWYYQSGGGAGRGDVVAQLYFQAAERLPQYDSERVLWGRLAQLHSVTPLRGFRLVEAMEGGDSVSATIEAVDGTGTRTLSASYLVGSDGVRSRVRSAAGIETTTRQLGGRMVLLVFRSTEFERHLSNFPDTTTVRILKPELEGHWQFFGRVDARDTFFFHAPVPDDQSLEPEALNHLMEYATGFRLDAEIQHAGFWDLRITIADEYRRGRIFIAGDACHGHPPYGGFGLNTGLEDARNLGWKLAAALRGWGGEGLLESYALERRPVFVQTADVIAGGIETERVFLEAHNPDRDRAGFESVWSDISRRLEGGRYMPHYAGSPVVVGASGSSPGIDGLGTREASSGQHLAPAVLSDGRNVFEALGSGFHLLALDRPEAALAFEDAASRVGVPLATTLDTFAGERADYRRRLVLIRPDQFIAWAGDEAPEDVPGLLRRVSGLG
ncbi:MAG: FAD-dependent monooxygenase [Caulobacteraceae bacterium]|nr:FAD-dependent monooxygenase [Caulobacteraceae bacterium]